tara:strand:- start:324 stop:479 length:156 start_codon:yes stop_codon:yes gene_type:complete
MTRLEQAINQTIANMNGNEKADFIYNTLIDYYTDGADEEEMNTFIDEVLGA